MYPSCHFVYQRIVSIDVVYKPRKSRQKFCENLRDCVLSHIKTPSRLWFHLCFAHELLMIFERVKTNLFSFYRCIGAEDNCKKYQKTIEQLNKNIDELNSAMIELGQENQNLQVVQNMRNSRKWEKDSEVVQCNGCSKKFSVSIRKVRFF